MIIDEFGILKNLYEFAKIVYVGGGFNKRERSQHFRTNIFWESCFIWAKI